MHRRLNQAALGTALLTLLACNGGGDSKAPLATTAPGQSPSGTMAAFVLDKDVTKVTIPHPNVLATATAGDPLTSRLPNKPMTPPEALAYVNLHEMGGTHAVAGVNAPVYIQFTAAVDKTTVTPSNIKVFEVTPDATTGFENGALGFTDISATFSYRYATGSTDLFLFPEFPLQPGKRYLYVVTNRVMDAASPSKPISPSPQFEALKSATALAGPLADLEAVRRNKLADDTKAQDNATNPILLSGYAKVMNDLITASATTTVASRGDIVLLGRFITTGAGAISLTTDSPSAAGARLLPVESALRGFAFGSSNGLGGLLAGKTWINTIAVPANTPTSISTFVAGTAASPDLYWAAVLTAGGHPVTASPATVGTVVLGSFSSADLSIDPAVAQDSAHVANMDLTGVANAYNPAAGVTQAFRASHNLVGFYHTDRAVPFVYIAPNPAVVGAAPAGGWPVVIYQHGITSQKESVLAVAESLTAIGRAVVAIDMPLHGALAVPTHTTGTSWGTDFMAVGAPLATRSNIQQGAFHLDRLEFVLRAGAFGGLGAAAPTVDATKYKFLGHSLGAIVGACYLAGNTSFSYPAGPSGPPYIQSTLNGDMKGYMAVPGGRTAYIIQNSPAFNGPNADPAKAYPIDKGLSDAGIAPGSPSYHIFFQMTQSVIDPVDPATLTTPLAAGLPSRFSGRIAIQESTSSSYSATLVGKDLLPMPVNGDTVITNAYTRYFANALGGREVLGTTPANAAIVNAIAPQFKQLAYTAGGTPAHAAGVVGTPFLHTLTAGAVANKVADAATSAAAVSPAEGLFQFDQTAIGHSSLLDPSLDPTAGPINTGLLQKQMRYFLLLGIVTDPTQGAPALPVATVPVKGLQVPMSYTILGY